MHVSRTEKRMQQGTDGTRMHFFRSFVIFFLSPLSLSQSALGQIANIPAWNETNMCTAYLMHHIVLLQATNCKVPWCCFCCYGFWIVGYAFNATLYCMHFFALCREKKNFSDSVCHFHWYRPLWQVHHPLPCIHAFHYVFYINLFVLCVG